MIEDNDGTSKDNKANILQDTSNLSFLQKPIMSSQGGKERKNKGKKKGADQPQT